tara:strand:+ start:8651 stop:9640 length:990 start_codon:yes stop_codon:yes gene_type:complete
MKEFNDSINWFNEQKEFLCTSYNHHSYIFEGREGIGKKSFALDFAKSLLCLSSTKNKSCNDCKACYFFDEQTHPDFYQINLEKDKTQISINQIRSIQQPLYESPFLGGNKVFLIHPLQALNKEAFNTILKNLEEPPKNSYFLLITDAYHSIPLTIKSRSIKINLNNPHKDEVKKWLKSKGVKENIDMCINFAKQRPMIALKLSTLDIKNIRSDFIRDISILIKTGKNILEISESWIKNEEEFLIKIEWMSDLLMDSLRHKFFSGLDLTCDDTDAISKYLSQQNNSEDFFYLLTKTNMFWTLFSSNNNLRVDYHLQDLFVEWNERVGLRP